MEKINGAALFSLQDKIIVVTGGASGIGRTVANYMAAMGAHIAIFDVSAEKAEAVQVLHENFLLIPHFSAQPKPMPTAKPYSASSCPTTLHSGG